MLSHLYRKHIGFLLLPGCHDADLVNMQTILSMHPRNYYYFIGRKQGEEEEEDNKTVRTPCQSSGLSLIVDTDLFDFHQELDVLVIVGYDDDDNVDEDDRSRATRDALKQLAISSKKVVAIGNGVLALAKTGLLSNHRVRCAPSNKVLRKQLQPLVGEIVSDLENNDDDDDDHKNIQNRLSIPTVCESGKFITASPTTGAMEAALLVLAQLRGTFVASFAELFLEYAPTVRFSNVVPVQPETHLQSLQHHEPPLKVGVLLTKELFLPDVIGALSVFRALPHCQIIGIVLERTDIPTMLGPTVAKSMKTMCTLKDCPQLDVFVVGATMPWVLCHSAIVEFVRNQASGCKAMIGICAGALLLGSAGLLEGKSATTNFQMKPLLPTVGATTNATNDDDLVVVDDEKFIFTAGPVIGSYEAALLVVAKLYGDGVAAYIEQNVLYYQNPRPPFNVGHAHKAGRGLLLVTKVPVVSFINPFFWYCAKKGLAMTHRRKAIDTERGQYEAHQ